MNRLTVSYKTLRNNLFVFLINTCVVFVSLGQDEQHSMLWEVTGNGLESPSYLFGIINFLPEDQFIVSEGVKSALTKCKVFVTKTPISRANRKEFNKAARIPDDGWINDYLSDDELNQLRLLMLKDLEVTEDDYHFLYSRLQPVILVTATTLLYLGDNVVFVEDQLAKLAKKRHLKFKSLGTIEEEISAFEKFPLPDQVEALKYTVANFNKHINDYERLVQYYMDEQDPKKIKDAVLKATNRSKEFQQVYYDDRNIDWVKKIQELTGRNPSFIAVGAAHLYGKTGLLQLMTDSGFKMTPVKAF